MRPLGPDDPRGVGSYRILRVLGAGGMGRVYVGRSRTGRAVAVKLILPGLADDPGFRARFRREVEAARRVGGAWTAPVLDADTEAAQPWLVTGYVPGLSLGEAVAERGPLPEATVRTLGAGLAAALAAVHGAGVVHRDLKPSNVMLSPDGPRVIDFGISRAVDASVLTGTGLTVGSPGFMSPEQIEGRDVGPATDVFSLGTVLTYAATGGGPFGDGGSQAVFFRILSQEPRLDAVPDGLRPLVAACLAKDAADRPTPDDVLRALSPDGDVEALVAAGWLPPELANEVSRRAVALLELEDEPAPQTSWTAPVFGGPPASAPTQAATHGQDAPPYSAPPTYPASPYEAPTAPPFEADKPAPAPRKHNRRLYGVAAAAVAVVAALASFLLTRDQGDHSDNATHTSGPPITGGPTTPTTLPHPTGEGTLPGAFVGTWTGTITTQDGLLPQQLTLTLHAGRTGDVVGSTKVTVVGLDCTGDEKLVAVSPTVVTVADVPNSGGTGNPLCTSGGEATIRLQPDGRLLYSTVAAGTGNPSGTLAKS
ncbi:serine/threonine protein kinase [Yinghuangia seranimata]|uniref:serine/threonine protein kinase n=1 Tax=Yinghuangia seranimata TaxID=408067 RepID=UPI00248C6F9B|nr:serine/threonine protein kinase [Yinghuangia seranimata]MDI2129031.1 protein kinase [Yinghuangia seranimata]